MYVCFFLVAVTTTFLLVAQLKDYSILNIHEYIVERPQPAVTVRYKSRAKPGINKCTTKDLHDVQNCYFFGKLQLMSHYDPLL